jgi:hypothetical protein
MAPAKKNEIAQPRFATISPVFDVMGITDAKPATGESAAAVAMRERAVSMPGPCECAARRSGHHPTYRGTC